MSTVAALFDSTSGEVVGTAVVKLRADSSSVAGDVHSGLSKGFSSLSSILSSAGINLGPLNQALDAVGAHVDDVTKRGLTMGKALEGGGLGLTALGGIGVALADPLEKAEATLKTVITNAGHDLAQYQGQIDSVDKHMEHFGHTTSDTDTAIATLTAGTGSPSKAIAEMGDVSEIAAYKHESLASAAQQVVMVLAGNTRMLKQFGIDVKASTTAVSDATKANKAHATAMAASSKASDKLQAAQQHLSDVEAEQAAKKRLTVSDEIALRDARQKVAAATSSLADAQDKAAATANAATTAQKAAADGAIDGAKALDLIHDKIKGVDEAQAKTFGGHLDAARAKVTDFVARTGQSFGHLAIVAGPALAGFGGILQTGLLGKLKDLVSGAAQGAAAVVRLGVSALAGGTEAGAGGEAASLGWLPFLGAVAVVAGAAYLIYRNWGTISAFFKQLGLDIWHAIDGAWQHVLSSGETMVAWIKALPGRAYGFLVHVFDGLLDSFKYAIKAIEDLVKHTTITVPGTNIHVGLSTVIAGIPGVSGLAALTHLAAGGVVRASPGGSIVNVGEGGEDEAVIPLSRFPGFGGGQNGGATYNVAVTVPLSGYHGNATELAHDLAPAMVKEFRRLQMQQR